jgi:anhydro-N-acetylmuramic acid kinase
MSIYVGVMSGTSLDGIDVAIVDLEEQQLSLISAELTPFSAALRQDLLDLIATPHTHLQQLGQINIALGHAFAEAINQALESAHLTSEDIVAIGCHGQTIYHSPDSAYPFTMQIGDANVIAALTGIDTITDFRQRDMVLGGQGAPLVPAFHQAMFGKDDLTRVIVNIGGIANITVLPAASLGKPVIGFDTGPGNCLMDSWYQLHHDNYYDAGGEWAKRGHIDNLLMSSFLHEPFFIRETPKSTGREYFNLNWLNEHLSSLDKPIPAEDVQRTLVELTAITISHAIKEAVIEPYEIYICGGGARNQLLMNSLTSHLAPNLVDETTSLGLEPDWVEACAFAWLAKQTIEGKPGNLPAVTGANELTILGAVYPSNKRK